MTSILEEILKALVCVFGYAVFAVAASKILSSKADAETETEQKRKKERKNTSEDVKLLLSIKGNDHSEEENLGTFSLWREEFDGTTQFNSDSKQNKLFRRLLDEGLTEKVKTQVLDGKQTRGNRVKVY